MQLLRWLSSCAALALAVGLAWWVLYPGGSDVHSIPVESSSRVSSPRGDKSQTKYAIEASRASVGSEAAPEGRLSAVGNSGIAATRESGSNQTLSQEGMSIVNRRAKQYSPGHLIKMDPDVAGSNDQTTA
jgi:hypothetical protein